MRGPRRDRGATLIIMAVALPVLITMTAVATDLGRQRSSRRTMQARADIVALDMVRLADGRTEDQITGLDTSAGTTPAIYAAYVQDTADRNDVDVAKLEIDWGTWDGSTFTPTVGNASPSAVKVVASETTDYFFRPGSGDVTRSAVATTEEQAGLSIGSTLTKAELASNATVFNAVITGLLCGSPLNPPPPVNPPPPASACPNKADVSAGGYNGMATHDIDLDDLRAAGGFASVDEMMDQEMTAEEFATISGQAFRNNGDPSTAEAYDGEDNSLRKASVGASGTFKMRDVMDAKSPGDGSVGEANVNPFDIFMAGLQVANGENFVDMPLTVPPTSLPVGLTNLALTSRYKVIETPRSGWGRVGDAATTNMRTAQLQVLHTAVFTVNLSVAGTGVTGTFSLPVDVQGGGATATLTAINCERPDTDSTIDVLAAPRVFTGSLGKNFGPGNPVTVGSLNLTVAGIPSGAVGISVYGSIGPASQNFNSSTLPAIAIKETRSVPGSSFGLGGGITSVKLQTAAPVGALETALLANLNLAMALVDAASQPVLGALGMSVSEADIRNLDTHCVAVRLAD